MSTFNLVTEVLKESITFDNPTLNTKLESLNLFELDFAEFVNGLETEFNIKIDDDKAVKFKTLSDIVDYIDKEKAQAK